MELSEIVVKEWAKGWSLDGWKKRWESVLCNAYETADNVVKDEAILCRGAQAIPLTIDHKPDRAYEMEMITTNRGKILYWGCSRVEGILSVSMAIGDHNLKTWIVSTPEVTFTARTEEDVCLVLARDGLWDVLSNGEVAKLARTELRRRRKLGASSPADYVSRKIVKKALMANTEDNISIIVIDFNKYF
ncbi:hypothetical protein V6N11_064040 [Hibiscus sabdariffa]|uniref:PPM-type phosphatase domain-containing protein n=1 Tax=Hibiscus sabdariffa TaxID=183260 RepID=A0ABR2PMH8_9ROSI